MSIERAILTLCVSFGVLALLIWGWSDPALSAQGLLRRSAPHESPLCSGICGCYASNWTKDLQQYASPPLIASIDEACRQLAAADAELGPSERPPSHLIYYRTRVISYLLESSPSNKRLWEDFFGRVIADTRVHVLIGSKDRAAALSSVLQLLREYQKGPIRVSISYEGSNDVHVAAYQSLQRDFPQYDFIPRAKDVEDHLTPYSSFLQWALTTNSTNFAVFSDDTWMRLPASFAAIGALQRVLSNQPDSLERPYVIASELRWKDGMTSMPSMYGSQFVSSVPAHGDLARMVLYNTSKCILWTTGHRVCYNRDIDGPIFRAADFKTEFSHLNLRGMTHPASFEGSWENYREANLHLFDDFVLAPADEIVFNNGLQMVTVREEGSPILKDKSASSGAALRLEFSKAISEGCRQNPLSPEIVQWARSSSESHRYGVPMPWNCPAGIIPPEVILSI